MSRCPLPQANHDGRVVCMPPQRGSLKRGFYSGSTCFCRFNDLPTRQRGLFEVCRPSGPRWSGANLTIGHSSALRVRPLRPRSPAPGRHAQSGLAFARGFGPQSSHPMGQWTSIELIGLAVDGTAALAVATHAASRSSRALPIVSMVGPKSFALQAGREIRLLVQSEQGLTKTPCGPPGTLRARSGTNSSIQDRSR